VEFGGTCGTNLKLVDYGMAKGIWFNVEAQEAGGVPILVEN
jgi:hypothetical protein